MWAYFIGKEDEKPGNGEEQKTDSGIEEEEELGNSVDEEECWQCWWGGVLCIGVEKEAPGDGKKED